MNSARRASVLAGLLTMACATQPPLELKNARVAYGRVSVGPAARYAPAELRAARAALDEAEAGFARDKSSPTTITLAYVAERTARIADARAGEMMAQQAAAGAKSVAARTVEASASSERLRDHVAAADRCQAEDARFASADRAARELRSEKSVAFEDKAAAREQEAKAAVASRARFKAKDEERGVIITLSGDLLFRPSEAGLLATADSRLDAVANKLVARDRNVVVEGHAGSERSSTSNLQLSQRRAEAVRDYLVTKGVPEEKILARGVGPDRPSAEVERREGPADDRRVEITVEGR